MTTQVVFAEVTEKPLDAAALSAQAGHDAAGTVITFSGVVRNHDLGQPVDSIEYSAHPQATEIIASLAAETATRDGVHSVAVAHRVGHLRVGDVALVAVVAAEHRNQGFDAVIDLVEEVKKRLPVWKKQHFTDGHTEWTGL